MVLPRPDSCASICPSRTSIAERMSSRSFGVAASSSSSRSILSFSLSCCFSRLRNNAFLELLLLQEKLHCIYLTHSLSGLKPLSLGQVQPFYFARRF